MSNSQKSSFNNNEKNNDKKADANNKLGKVDEETHENLDNEDNKKKNGQFPAGHKNNSSKNFDINDFNIENTENLFDNEAPLVPPHLSQILFISVISLFCLIKISF